MKIFLTNPRKFSRKAFCEGEKNEKKLPFKNFQPPPEIESIDTQDDANILKKKETP